ncbi:MAG: filamentous hemagglutinin N-terminal domain-containing protein [Chlamydiales bacterium]|nr:filamentous hemagglutinin N-terminal domain-containing protein [Chlamydiales bacterium]
MMKKRHLFLLLFALGSQPLAANPKGASIQSGAVHIEANGPTLQIQASDRAIIHWEDFSIQNLEITRFIQPSQTAAVLNRVTGFSPSLINGTLEANGRVNSFL